MGLTKLIAIGGLLALVMAPVAIEGACCMTSLPESQFSGIMTCADGPCPTGLNAKRNFAYQESTVPTACCNVAENKEMGWFYSGPKGTPGCFWPDPAASGPLRLPCSGNVCDKNEEPVVCRITSQAVGAK